MAETQMQTEIAEVVAHLNRLAARIYDSQQKIGLWGDLSEESLAPFFADIHLTISDAYRMYMESSEDGMQAVPLILEVLMGSIGYCRHHGVDFGETLVKAVIVEAQQAQAVAREEKEDDNGKKEIQESVKESVKESVESVKESVKEKNIQEGAQEGAQEDFEEGFEEDDIKEEGASQSEIFNDSRG